LPTLMYRLLPPEVREAELLVVEHLEESGRPPCAAHKASRSPRQWPSRSCRVGMG
jgi:hypothetical protein